MRLIALALLTAVLIAGVPPAPVGRAQVPGEVVLPGRAQTGTDVRDVRFNFACTSNDGPTVTGVLAVELAMPGYKGLASVFPFDDFEGPDADAGERTILEVTGPRGTVRGRFAAAGWIGVEADQSFHLGVSSGLRRDARHLAAVATVLRKVVVGPGTLVWRQESTKPGGMPIIATLAIAPADAARLRSLLTPCLVVAGRGGR
jgi:hypothetical protein